MNTSPRNNMNNKINEYIRNHYSEIKFTGINTPIVDIKPRIVLTDNYAYDGPQDYPISGTVEITLNAEENNTLTQSYRLVEGNSVFINWVGETPIVKVEKITGQKI